jgi:hypothetical protein
VAGRNSMRVKIGWDSFPQLLISSATPIILVRILSHILPSSWRKGILDPITSSVGGGVPCEWGIGRSLSPGADLEMLGCEEYSSHDLLRRLIECCSSSETGSVGSYLLALCIWWTDYLCKLGTANERDSFWTRCPRTCWGLSLLVSDCSLRGLSLISATASWSVSSRALSLSESNSGNFVFDVLGGIVEIVLGGNERSQKRWGRGLCEILGKKNFCILAVGYSRARGHLQAAKRKRTGAITSSPTLPTTAELKLTLFLETEALPNGCIFCVVVQDLQSDVDSHKCDSNHSMPDTLLSID